MAVVNILQYPDPRLKTKAERVQEVDQTVQQMVDDMFDTYDAAENCAALAATQLDFQHPKAITVVDISPEKDQHFCLINPEIIASEGEQFEYEGCMSVYPNHIHERVKRAMWVKVKALDREGKIIEMEAEGYLAKCLQHEIDHLNGLVYLDRLSSLKRQRIDKKIMKIIKNMTS